MEPGFEDVRDEIVALLRQGRHDEAYAVATRRGADFPRHEADLYYLRARAVAEAGDDDRAAVLLDEALRRGHWYGEAMLRQPSSFARLQGTAAFEQVARRSLERRLGAQTGAYPLVRRPANGSPPYRTVVALHGNGGTAAQAMQAWRPVVSGRLVAALQSTQWVSSAGAVWDDERVALRDVRGQYAALTTAHRVSGDGLVVVGFSAGAHTALHAALDGSVPARGAVLIGLAGPRTDEPSRWRPLLERWRGRGAPLRVQLLVGADDDGGLRAVKLRRLAATLVEHGIACRVEVLAGVGHAYPRDLAPVRRALSFVDA